MMIYELPNNEIFQKIERMFRGSIFHRQEKIGDSIKFLIRISDKQRGLAEKRLNIQLIPHNDLSDEN